MTGDETRARLLQTNRALADEIDRLEAQAATHAETVARLEQELATWKTCSNCGEQMDAPGHCGRAIHEEVKGLHQMHDETLTRAEQAEAQVAALTAENATLRAKVRTMALDATTAGANPQKDGGMSAPLWFVKCKACGERWDKKTWKYDEALAAHPANSCLAAPDGDVTP